VTAVLDPVALRPAVTPWVSTAARLVLGGVLVIAGAVKVADPQASVAAVRAYELLPAGLETVVGWGLPFLELVLGLLLLTGIAVRPTALATALLLAVFIAAVASAAARGLSIDCGCFGGGGPVPPGQTAYAAEIVRDLGLLAAAAWLVARPQSRLSLGGHR
jgi:uncharacterized membrane protein YphA (DoxX/SURF4 family)